MIEEHNGIKISYTPLRNLLVANGIPSPRKHRKTKSHHRRKRKGAMGMMLQADGTPHDWFETGSMQSLHGFIDDATGVVTGLYMCENECLHGYLEVTRQTLINHGIPMSLYPDRQFFRYYMIQVQECKKWLIWLLVIFIGVFSKDKRI